MKRDLYKIFGVKKDQPDIASGGARGSSGSPSRKVPEKSIKQMYRTARNQKAQVDNLKSVTLKKSDALHARKDSKTKLIEKNSNKKEKMEFSNLKAPRPEIARGMKDFEKASPGLLRKSIRDSDKFDKSYKIELNRESPVNKDRMKQAKELSQRENFVRGGPRRALRESEKNVKEAKIEQIQSRTKSKPNKMSGRVMANQAKAGKKLFKQFKGNKGQK